MSNLDEAYPVHCPLPEEQPVSEMRELAPFGSLVFSDQWARARREARRRRWAETSSAHSIYRRDA